MRRPATGNPFLAARHDLTLRQNPRRKGSALYGGYETDCRFSWRLKNRQSLYLNLCAVAFLSFAAWLLAKHLAQKTPLAENLV